MPFLKGVTHPDLNTEEKVNFFSNYFILCNARLGQLKEFDFENHLALVERCIHAIDNNLEKSTPYLTSMFSRRILDPSDFISRFPSSQIVFPLVSSYLSKRIKQRASWLKENPQLLGGLRCLANELHAGMLQEAISSLITFLRCKHKLVTHRRSIKYCTLIIVSEFRYRGFSKKDVEGVIGKILTKDIKRFPFPRSVTDERNRGDYDELRSRYLAHRTFDEQFRGILNLFEREVDYAYFIYRIRNVSVSGISDFEFHYDNVVFMHPNHSKLKKLRNKVRDHRYLKDFFKSSSKMIMAACRVRFTSQDVGEEEAINSIAKELDFFEDRLKGNFALDKSIYLLTSDFSDLGAKFSSQRGSVRISNDDVDGLMDNPFTFLSECREELKSQILFYEHDYRAAQKMLDVSKLWQYLENIIPLDENGIKQVRSVVSHSLLVSHRDSLEYKIRSDFSNAVSSFSVSHERLGISLDEQMSLMRDWSKINLRKLKPKFSIPILREYAELYEIHSSRRNLLTEKVYYDSILLDAYLLRNHMVHQGVFSEKLDKKMRIVFSDMVFSYRLLLLQKIKEGNLMSFEEVVTSIHREGLKLLDPIRNTP